jgi:hypothetical protein
LPSETNAPEDDSFRGSKKTKGQASQKERPPPFDFAQKVKKRKTLPLSFLTAPLCFLGPSFLPSSLLLSLASRTVRLVIVPPKAAPSLFLVVPLGHSWLFHCCLLFVTRLAPVSDAFFRLPSR